MSGSTQVIDATREGQRIDNYLFSHLKGVPKSLIYRLLRTGKIRVNGKRVNQTYRLQENDEIKIPSVRTTHQAPVKICKSVQDQINACIIYEDDDLLVINKPAGIAVHPGSRVSYGVIEVLREIRSPKDYLELVHRLDRDTSGCLLIAKNKSILNELHNLLREKKISKKYLLLVKGEWNLGVKSINTPLRSKGQSFSDEINGYGWKDALTVFQPIKLYQGYSLLEAQLKTGRTHQIRLHAAQIGFPIVGDSKYGDFTFNRECKRKGLNRMFLHASEVSLQLSSKSRPVRIKAPLSNELQVFLDGLVLQKDDFLN